MRSPAFSRLKNTAEIAAMPDGKATAGASSRCDSISSTASQVGLSEDAHTAQNPRDCPAG